MLHVDSIECFSYTFCVIQNNPFDSLGIAQDSLGVLNAFGAEVVVPFHEISSIFMKFHEVSNLSSCRSTKSTENTSEISTLNFFSACFTFTTDLSSLP